MSPIRILCTGDLHLGRHPSRLPSVMEELSVRATWDRFVGYAISQRVDAVALTGDLIDRANRFYRGFWPFAGRPTAVKGRIHSDLRRGR